MPAPFASILGFVAAIQLSSSLLGAQSPVIPSNELRALEGITKKLAKGGLPKQTHSCLDVLAALGYPERKLSSLRKTCTKDLRRPKHSKANLSALAKQVRDAGTKLSAHLTTVTGDERTSLARLILKLDDKNDASHEALGHQKVDGEWKESWIAKVEARNLEVNIALDKARDLPINLVKSESSNSILNAALGRPATQVRYADITIHSTMSPGVVACVLAEAMRASAFASWLLEGQLTPGRTRPFAVLLIDDNKIYQKVVAALQSSGALSSADAKRYANQNHFWDGKNEQFVKFTTIPEEAQSYITFEALRDRPGFLPQPWIMAGLFNWVSLSYHGWRIPLYNAVTVTAKDASANAKMSISKAGISGSRAHLANLARRGRAPVLDESFQHEIGAIHGDNLLFASSMVEFLTYMFDLGSICDACPSKDAIDTKKRTAQIEAATKMPIAELHERWTRWITNKSTSVAGSLSIEDRAGSDREAKALVTQLNAVRAKVLAKIASAPKITLDADLSQGCARHAELLDSDPKAIGSTSGNSNAGAWAAQHALCVTSAGDIKTLVGQWMAALDTRAAILQPGLTRVGFARSKSSVVLDCRSMIQPVREEVMLGWPYNGMTRVPTSLGYPISFQVRRTSTSPQGAITMKLFEGKPVRKREVECEFISPGTTSRVSRVSPNLYALIPKSLTPGKTYYVVVEFSGSKKKHVWSFKT